MTTSRLFPSTNGPSSPVSYSGNILTGVLFKVTQGGMWFNGYYKWVATGEDTTARKFALWTLTGSGAATLIPTATVTSGTLTANSWNFVPLATPIPLAIGTTYNACTGWAAVSGHGFSDSDTSGAGTGAADSYGAGGHTAGITQGPLFAYSDIGSSKPPPYSFNQGLFSVAGTDPTVNMPGSGSNGGNFWMDVQVSDTGPVYAGSYRLYPNKVDAGPATSADASVNYSVATEFELSQACTLNKIWYYSPSGTAQLATSCRIWSIQGANAGTSVVTNTSPTWSGAAASGWVSCSFTGVTLPAGSYKVSAYNGAATPDGAFAKQLNYWDSGDGASGITWGPLAAPGLSSASAAYEFNGSNPGSTPQYTNGVTEPGQSTFVNGTGDTYPSLYVDGLAQNYWLDVEVTPVTSTPVSGSETGSGTDAGTVAASVPGADTAGGAEGTPAVGFTGPDAGSGADAGTPAAALAGAETGAGTETTAIGLAGPDAGSGADAGTIGVAAAGSDTGAGLDAGTAGASVPGTDAGTGADAGSVVIPGSVPELRAGLLGGTASNANLYAGSAS